MVGRAENAAATRQAVLAAAADLLDAGGPSAVTLREVGARVGLTRSAPYRHFVDKEGLLTALATQAWSNLDNELHEIATSDVPAVERLRRALMALIRVGRQRPHLYRLMFIPPAGDPGAAVRAAERTQDQFLRLVAGVVGNDDAWTYGGVFFTSAHGITDLGLSGHLVPTKWPTAESLVDVLVGLLPSRGRSGDDQNEPGRHR